MENASSLPKTGPITAVLIRDFFAAIGDVFNNPEIPEEIKYSILYCLDVHSDYLFSLLNEEEN